MIKVFIDGQAGTTGLQLKKKLLNHPYVELVEIDAEKVTDEFLKDFATEVLSDGYIPGFYVDTDSYNNFDRLFTTFSLLFGMFFDVFVFENQIVYVRKRFWV